MDFLDWILAAIQGVRWLSRNVGEEPRSFDQPHRERHQLLQVVCGIGLLILLFGALAWCSNQF